MEYLEFYEQLIENKISLIHKILLVKLKAIEVCFHNQYTNCNDELFEQHSVKIYKDH